MHHVSSPVTDRQTAHDAQNPVQISQGCAQGHRVSSRTGAVDRDVADDGRSVAEDQVKQGSAARAVDVGGAQAYACFTVHEGTVGAKAEPARMLVIGHLSGAGCRRRSFCVALNPRRGGRTPTLLFDGHHRLLQRTGADDARPKPDLHPKPEFLSLTAFVAQHGHVDDGWRQHHIALEAGARRGAVRAGEGHVKA